MSLSIDVNRVEKVLLADGWHHVAEQSFDLDAYEFVDEGVTVHGGGATGITATGYVFRTQKGAVIAGPLTAVLAVAYEA